MEVASRPGEASNQMDITDNSMHPTEDAIHPNPTENVTSEETTTNDMDITTTDTETKIQEHDGEERERRLAQEAAEMVQREAQQNEMLLQARSLLQQPDAILDVDVFANIKRFFDAGGSPLEIIKSLSGSYRGYPQMCNLISQWLRIVGTPEEEIVAAIENHIHNAIMAKFDPQKADKIFEMGSAPSWLADMISHSHWRHLIYKLSEMHRDCLLLNYGIQQISEAGHDAEIASLPSASTYFAVFNRVLSETIQKALRQSESELSSSLAEFSRMCCDSEHAFIYTQAVLTILTDSDPSGRLKRISEELDGRFNYKYARSLHPIDITASTMTYIDGETNNSDSHEKEQFCIYALLHMTNMTYYPEFSSSFLSVMRSTTPSPVDVRNIHNAFIHPSAALPAGTFNPDSPSSNAPIPLGMPPAEYLRNPHFLDKIIFALFDPQQEVPSEFLPSYLWLLAYASCSTDSRKIAALQPPQPTDRMPNEEHLDAIIDAIREVRTTCRKISIGMAMQDSMEKILTYIHFPVVSMTVLFWIRSCLCDPEKVSSSWAMRFLQSQMVLLREIAATHPLQRPRCLHFLEEIFSLESTVDPLTASAAKKKFMEFAAYLIECGLALPVLERVEAWAPTMDQSLIRHFLLTVLDMAGPPYSIAFLEPLIRLLSLVRLEASEHRYTALTFVNHVLKPGEYQLSSTQRDNLTKIQKNCSNR